MDIYIDLRFIEKDAFFNTINSLLLCDVKDEEELYHFLLHVKHINLIFLYALNKLDDQFIKLMKKADRKNRKIHIIIEDTYRCY